MWYLFVTLILCVHESHLLVCFVFVVALLQVNGLKVKGLPEMDSPAQLSRSSSNVAENQRRLEELFGEQAPGARPGTPASSKPYSPSSPLQPRKNSFGRPAVRFAAPAAAPKSPGPSKLDV